MLTGHQNDSLVTVDPANAFNITIQQIWLNNQRNAPKILMGPPASGAGPRLLFADYIMCIDNTTGMVLRNLGAKDTVLIGGLYNPLSVIGSAAAVVLVNFHEGGYTTVAKNGDTHGTQIPVDGDAAESDRAGPPDTTGFMGELVKVPATGVAFALIVRDSSTYVVGDFYEESNIQIVYISGTAADKTPGRVTMSNVKHHTSAQQSSPINNPIYIVSRYLPLRCIHILRRHPAGLTTEGGVLCLVPTVDHEPDIALNLPTGDRWFQRCLRAHRHRVDAGGPTPRPAHHHPADWNPQPKRRARDAVLWRFLR